MQTSIGKKFRTRKVKLAYEKRLLKQKELNTNRSNSKRKDPIEAFHGSTGGVNNETVELLNFSTINETYCKDQQAGSKVTNSGSNTTNNLNGNSNINNKQNYEQGNYDTVTSVHDIEQDGHVYNFPAEQKLHRYLNERSALPRIAEVPNRNNPKSGSISDVSDSKA